MTRRLPLNPVDDVKNRIKPVYETGDEVESCFAKLNQNIKITSVKNVRFRESLLTRKKAANMH
jgi:hypothetical protein